MRPYLEQMSRFTRRDRRARTASSPGDDLEDPVVRQYRFLLRTAPSDALEAAHSESLPTLRDADRTAVLTAVQAGLLVGQRLGPDAVTQIAHLVVNGERRAPGAFLRSCPSVTLRRLARAVVDSGASFGLFGGYADWDGADPQPPDDSQWMDAGFNPDSGRWNIARGTGRDNSGIVHGGGGGWGGGLDGGGAG
jgi:hypothetical protein